MAKKKKKQIESSCIYMVSPASLTENGVEKMRKTRDNCFGSHPEYKHLSQSERSKIWDKLKESISTQGFFPEWPIVVQLLRKDGERDQIKQGHHRLAIALELGLVLVRFIYRSEEDA